MFPIYTITAAFGTIAEGLSQRRLGTLSGVIYARRAKCVLQQRVLFGAFLENYSNH